MNISLTHVILISLALLALKLAGFNIEYWVVALPVLIYMCLYLLVLAPAIFIVGIIVVFLVAWIWIVVIASTVVIVLFLIKEMWRKIMLKFKKK